MSGHCPDADLLLAYATGTAPEAVALVIATHLALCPNCRIEVVRMEALGGEMLERLEPVTVDADQLAKLLARLDGLPVEAPPAPVTPPPGLDVSYLPEPLRTYAARSTGWKFVLPGVKKIELPGLRHAGQPVWLTRTRGGLSVPEHGHEDWELQLVLAGGYVDKSGHYTRGDVQFADSSYEHSFRTDDGEECVTLLVKSGRNVDKTWLGRLFAMLTGA